MNKQKFLQYCGYFGVLGIVCYFCHVIIGGLLYDNYDPISQAISDLTAKGSPSLIVARVFTAIYGICMIAFFTAFYLFFCKKINRVFSLGTMFLLIMQTVSFVGYTAFPLSEAGFARTFQDTMHLIVTIVVVITSITALILLAIGFFRAKHKRLGIGAIVTLFCMMFGSILLGAVPQVMGIGERLNIYALHIYFGILAVWLITYKQLVPV